MVNFIVSARKYRPATFISVVGQQHITSALKNAINKGQLAHAYLFCGPRGVGKTTCARIFAKAINCLSPVDGEACNECESCKAFNEGRSFSIHELDAASNNSVDDIRNLTDQVRIPPQLGKYSIYIIDEVHMLSLSAFNAFLKTLEEPPAHAVFILATTEKHKIIPTILSRCQIYDFNRIKPDDAVEYLKYISAEENIESDEESLHIIARKADGGMRDALSMFDKVVSFCGNKLDSATVSETLNVLDYETYFKAVDYIPEGDYQDCLILLDDVLRRGFSVQTFIAGLNDHFRNLLMCKDKRTASLLEVSGKTAENYFRQSEKFPAPIIIESISLLTLTDSGLRAATNQRLNTELALLKLCGFFQKKNPETSVTIDKLPDPKLPVISPRSETKTDKTVENSPEKTVADNKPTVAENPEIIDQPTPSPEKIKTAAAESISSVTGLSLKNIMNGKSTGATNTNEQQNSTSSQQEHSKIASEKEIVDSCAKLSEELLEERPRLAAAFKDVTVVGNSVNFTVSNETLKDEIEWNTIDLKKRLCEIGKFSGEIDFVIEVTEDDRPMRPIKAEDKLKYLVDKNPLLTEFRKSLNLDIE